MHFFIYISTNKYITNYVIVHVHADRQKHLRAGFHACRDTSVHAYRDTPVHACRDTPVHAYRDTCVHACDTVVAWMHADTPECMHAAFQTPRRMQATYI